MRMIILLSLISYCYSKIRFAKEYENHAEKVGLKKRYIAGTRNRKIRMEETKTRNNIRIKRNSNDVLSPTFNKLKGEMMQNGQNVKVLKLLMLYTLGVLKHTMKGEHLSGSVRQNQRSDVDRYINKVKSIREKIMNFAKYLNQMELTGTSDGIESKSLDENTFGSSTYMTPEKMISILKAVGNDEIAIPDTSSLTIEKEKQNLNSESEASIRDRDYDLIASAMNEDIKNKDQYVTGSSRSLTSSSGEVQVGEMLQSLQQLFSNNTQNKDNLQQIENAYLSPMKFNNLLESLSSDESSDNATGIDRSNKEEEASTYIELSKILSDNNPENETAKGKEKKKKILPQTEIENKGNSVSGKLQNTLSNVYISNKNDQPPFSLFHSNQSEMIDATSVNPKVSDRTAKRKLIDFNEPVSMELATRRATEDLGSILNNLLNGTEEKHENSTENIDDTININGESDETKKKNEKVPLSIILKYERLLKLLHSKLTSGKDWRQDTFVNISVSKFETLLDSLTTELISDDLALAKAKKQSKNQKDVEEIHNKDTIQNVTQKVKPKKEELKKKDKKQNSTPKVKPSKHKDKKKTKGVAKVADFNLPSKSALFDQIVNNTKLFHAKTLEKFKKLLSVLSFKNLIKSLPQLRFDTNDRHIHYYSFNDKFVHKMDELMKLLAFNRLFDKAMPQEENN